MKLLMTVQPKNGEKPSEPVIVDTDKINLCYLAEHFLHQPVAEYTIASCEERDKKE